MSREQILIRLRDLSAERPTTKMGQIRWAWPEIKAALAAGHTLQRVHESRAPGRDWHWDRVQNPLVVHWAIRTQTGPGTAASSSRGATCGKNGTIRIVTRYRIKGSCSGPTSRARSVRQ